VLHTRSNFEKRIAADLTASGVEAYLPAYEEVHQWKDRKKAVLMPLFPGYVFARFHDEPGTRLRVLQVSGVVCILGRDGRIESVPEVQIDSVRAMLNANAALVHPFLREGDWVRIKRGPLNGIEGILVRAAHRFRVVVSISLLARSVATEVDLGDVEPAKRY
jgi:transcription antitermination factor NusG